MSPCPASSCRALSSSCVQALHESGRIDHSGASALDVYSPGVVLFEILFRQRPWDEVVVNDFHLVSTLSKEDLE